MRRFISLLMLVAVAALAAAPMASAAKYKTAVGIGDQSSKIFSSAEFRTLHVKKVRYFIPWDAARHPDALAAADEYVAAARRAHARVLMHISTNDLRNKVGRLPSLSTYRKYVGKLVRRYKAKGVRDWGVWNEANHKSQETWNHPASAAKFFLAFRGMCKGCTIVALDVLDQAGVQNYIAKWFHALGSRNYRKATVIGIHNYSDTNRHRSSGTSRILRTSKSYNPRANFWLTETGGLASFGNAWPCNVTRQNTAVKYMFTLTRKFRRDITRLYSYNFFGTTQADCAAKKFDAGLVDVSGAPRPAYATFRSQARSFAR
jgi:hypothetical protein